MKKLTRTQEQKVISISSRPASTSYISWEYLEQISPGNSSFAFEMMRVFKLNAPVSISQMEEHLREGDLSALAKLAHTLRPMGQYLGIATLGTLCHLLERKALTGRNKDIPSLFHQIKSLTQRVVEEIDFIQRGMVA